MLGGEHFTPIDLINSKLQQETILREQIAYSQVGKSVFFLDFNFTYAINKPKRKTVWALQIKNLLNNGNALYREYDIIQDKTVEVKSTSFFPNLYYRLEF
jgi:hypothetical protein